MSDFIYFDYNASTPIAEEVLSSMLPYLTQHFGNPTSLSHSFSWAASGGLNLARKQVAQLFQCESSEIIFTSGATESINLALWGVLEQQKNTLLLTSNTEHSATYATVKAAENKGFKVCILDSDKDGLVPLDELKSHLTKDPQTPKFVSLILANNEIGSLYDLHTLSQLCQQNNALLHLDATQAVLTQKIDLSEVHIDLMSFSAHKIYGPKGVGALYINKTSLGHSLMPRLYGGGQEYGLRPGTPNVAGIVGLGEACSLVKKNQEQDQKHFENLYRFFIEKMKSSNLNFFLNGHPENRIFNNISITFPDHNQSSPLTLSLSPFCITQGASCGANSTGKNRVLSAIGLTEKEGQNTIRIGLGRASSVSDLEKLVEKLTQVI